MDELEKNFQNVGRLRKRSRFPKIQRCYAGGKNRTGRLKVFGMDLEHYIVTRLERRIRIRVVDYKDLSEADSFWCLEYTHNGEILVEF